MIKEMTVKKGLEKSRQGYSEYRVQRTISLQTFICCKQYPMYQRFLTQNLNSLCFEKSTLLFTMKNDV